MKRQADTSSQKKKRSREEATAIEIPALPIEMWHCIISHSSLFDLGSLKMTCRDLSLCVDHELKRIESEATAFDSMDMTYPYKDAFLDHEPLQHTALYHRWDRTAHSFVDALNIFMQNMLEYVCIFSFRYRGDDFNIVRVYEGITLVGRVESLMSDCCYCYRLRRAVPLRWVRGIIEKAIDTSNRDFMAYIGDVFGQYNHVRCRCCYDEKSLIIQHPYVKRERPTGLLSNEKRRITKSAIRRAY